MLSMWMICISIKSWKNRTFYVNTVAILTHWGRVTQICVSKRIITGSDNGLSPGRRQAIIWTNAGILLIGPLGTNFSEIWIEIDTFTFKKMHLKMSSGKWRPFCLGLNVLTKTEVTVSYPSIKSQTKSIIFKTMTDLFMNGNEILNFNTGSLVTPYAVLDHDLHLLIPALIQIMACHLPGDKPISEPMVVTLLTHVRHSASMC